MAIYTKKEQIKYLDVDKNNKLTNRAILNFMQDVAGEHAESLHDGLNDKEVTKTAWIILNWKLEVIKRPKYNETIEVSTWVSTIDKYFSIREFEIKCNKEMVAKATSKWVLIDEKLGRITRIPNETIEKYEANGNNIFKIEDRIKEKEESKLVYEETIGRTKIDTNNHLNNIYYLDLAVESLPEEVYEHEELNNVEITYKKASKYKEKLKCFYSKELDKHVVSIKGEKDNLHSIIKIW